MTSQSSMLIVNVVMQINLLIDWPTHDTEKKFQNNIDPNLKIRVTALDRNVNHSHDAHFPHFTYPHSVFENASPGA